MSSLIQLQKRLRAEENKRRAMRMREEREFMSNFKKNYRLSHLEDIRTRLAIESESRSASAVPLRTPPAAVTPQEGALDVPSATSSDGLTCTAELEASVACIAVTDGGATLWTAEADGSIGIRRGDNGGMVFSIAGDSGRTVTALAAFEASIFVGFSDGMMRVYDPHVFILSFEHIRDGEGAITAFSQTFNDKTFSSSSSGRISKWDSETNEFACVATCELGVTVTTLCSYGYQLFVGCDDGVIRVVDTDTVVPSRSFEGHRGPIGALLVVDGFLFSGSGDRSVGIWSIGTGEMLYALAAHDHAIASLVSDAVSHQLWSADTQGTIHLWSTNPDRGFQHLRQIDAMKGRPLRAIVGAVAVDSVKLWSLASNGDNKSWHVTNNRIEEGIRHSLNTMRTIIEQDRAELAKWADLIDTLRTVAESLRVTLSESAALLTHNGMRQKIFYTWKLFMLNRRVNKVRSTVSSALSNASLVRLLHPYFNKFAAFAAAKVEQRGLEATAVTALAEHRRTVVRNYAAKMRAVARLHERLAVLQLRAQVSEHSSRVSLRRRYWANFIRWHQRRRFFRQRNEVAELVMMQQGNRVSLEYFHRWRVFIRLRRLANVRTQLTTAFQFETSKGLTAQWFHRWQKYRRLAQRDRQRNARACLCLSANTTATYRYFFRGWMQSTLARRVASLTERRDHNAAHMVELSAQLSELDVLNSVRKDILVVEDDIATMRARKDALIGALTAIREERASAMEHITSARTARATDSTSRSQILAIFERLKLRLIDLASDATFIFKIAEKISRVGAPKLFLESHAQIKRSVVSLLGSEPLTAHWGATQENIQQLKIFETEAVMNSLRVLVISYDALSPSELRSMTTDDEITSNEEALYMLADQCLINRDMRRKSTGQRLGK